MVYACSIQGKIDQVPNNTCLQHFSHQKGYLTNVSTTTGRSMLRKLKRGIKLVMLTKKEK